MIPKSKNRKIQNMSKRAVVIFILCIIPAADLDQYAFILYSLPFTLNKLELCCRIDSPDHLFFPLQLMRHQFQRDLSGLKIPQSVFYRICSQPPSLQIVRNFIKFTLRVRLFDASNDFGIEFVRGGLKAKVGMVALLPSHEHVILGLPICLFHQPKLLINICSCSHLSFLLRPYDEIFIPILEGNRRSHAQLGRIFLLFV